MKPSSQLSSQSSSRLVFISPWLMAAACLILVALLAVFAFSNYRRELRLRDETLELKGRGLMSAVHTGLRVSLSAVAEDKGEGGETSPAPPQFVERMRQAIDQLQNDDDVRAVYLVDGDGQVLADGEDGQQGQLEADDGRFVASLEPGQVALRRVKSGPLSGFFLVALRYRTGLRLPFAGNGPPSGLFPFGRHRHMGESAGGGHMSPRWAAWQEELRQLDEKRLSLVVILDPQRFNAAVRRQMWQIFALTASLLLVGLGGWLSLIAVQGLRGSQERLGRLEQELRRHERLAALGKMAAGVAHELRNPLSSIKGLALILKEKLPEDSREDGAADLLIQEVGRLNRAIGDLLAYARPPRLEKTRMSLNGAARHAVELMRPDAAAIGVALEFSATVEAVVDADADKLSQVLLNLLMNAMQAMDKVKDDGRIDVAVAVEGKRAKLTVADTGCGIAPENLPKIFDPYFTTKSTGTGLGLALSVQIIEEHGGGIVAHSEPGRGTRMECFLPLAAEAGRGGA
ncbi:MAG: hypothetical protein LBH14_08340 [Desulfobulbaceae bacterium]|nr:hypothetical protein [Desulfobulbaceae bacterium]